MNQLFWALLMHFVGPLQFALLPDETIAISRDHSRHSRRVPGTSYAQGQDNDGFKLGDEGPETVINQTDLNSFDGNFYYSYSTNNGINVEVKGSQKQVGSRSGQVMEGQYSYTAPDGTPVTVKWYADETGFHATSILHWADTRLSS